ncbi:LysR family transcriptional regulator [Candidatus Methylomicrobium oryzae]|jgi:DNA-binding transcriptional LysR family regulator|uniref:LysR family transcriptional regulator n=1 Tax=Candidatus Methylomicrobium oryzae TaxID=2802053 RepID=UPI001920C870|nr:LysR family transcriptional regulator [Methylomicrobium sp. RS1]MBL1265192.1 LysR family transcriptional regulator [Methylomicrobium sp. RS1]
MTSLRNFDLNLLVAFDILMEELNVTRAAERMFVTQSAMSHVLHRLRQQLDDPLLIKTPSGMKPTPRALALIDPVKEVLKEVELLIRPPAAFEPLTSQRRFVLAATDYMELLLLPALSERISRLAPGIAVQVKRTEASFPAGALENGSLDVVLGFESVLNPPSHLNRLTLFSDRMACLARKAHPMLKNGLSLTDYVALPHMLISRTGSPVGLIDQKLQEMGMERRIQLTVPHFLSAPLIVAQTDMILSLPQRIAEQFTRFAALDIFPVPVDLPDYELTMIWHPLRDKDPALVWLRKQLADIGRTFAAL